MSGDPEPAVPMGDTITQHPRGHREPTTDSPLDIALFPALAAKLRTLTPAADRQPSRAVEALCKRRSR